ncbi:hypothetical protein EQG49_11245 [Periweissella cryptocerci]|uniref:Uncharacterized protein n=1 Tax=Periweissella cryptocerci TaxID=2506420 RepID=A0A4P6YVX2_9LACO|nr:hypothetical protein [Periweissella cryptocerci]QBO36982.1 hypothetical protein EQG49_11245 [Periweissella cryptocerci]
MAYTPIQIGANGADAVNAINSVAGLYDPATESLRVKNLEVLGTTKLPIASGTITLNSSAPGLTASYRVIGNVVQITLAGNVTGVPAWSGDTTIGTLPAGIPKPYGTVAARGFLLDVSTGSNFAAVRVDSSTGNIVVNANAGTPGSNDYWDGQVTYICA